MIDSVLHAIATGDVEDLKELLDGGYLDEDLLETKSVRILSFSVPESLRSFH